MENVVLLVLIRERNDVNAPESAPEFMYDENIKTTSTNLPLTVDQVIDELGPSESFP